MSIYVYDKAQGKVVERKPKDDLVQWLPLPNAELFQQYQETLEHCRRLMLGYGDEK